MKCVIANRCVKLFGRAIHCLSRIGDELFLEALKDGLALRTVNSSRSAYACFLFKENFFVEYSQECEQIDSSNPGELLKCKLSMKSVLAIFKSLATIEKTVEHCKVEFKPTDCRLVFMLYCRHGIVKTHNLTYQECESLQAVFSKELCPNLIQTQAKVLQDTVSNFPNSCEEISLQVCPDALKMKNYVGDEPDLSKVVYTEMSLVPEEFDNFQIGVDTVVTFCLKELRAVLAFSEFVNQPISLHFGDTGQPIVFALDSDATYCGDFVMATLSESDMLSQQTNNEATTATTAKNIDVDNDITNTRKHQNRGGKNRKAIPANKQKESQTMNGDDDSNDEQKVPKRKNTDQSKNSDLPKSKTIKKQSAALTVNERNGENKKYRQGELEKDDFFSESFPYDEDMLDISNLDTTLVNKSSTQTNKKLNTSILRSSSNKRHEDHKNNSKAVEILFGEEDEDNVLLCTPPCTKKPVKNFFSSYKEEDIQKNSKVLLAADTDDEED